MSKLQDRSRRHSRVDIDLAPMIDCIFILLIFFIVTSVFVKDPGIEVQNPDVSGSDVLDRSAVLIAISSEDRIYVDGQQVQPSQIGAMIRQAVVGPDSTLIIRADRAASHGSFATVYSEARRAGVQHVQFATARSERR
jgi:biopolymer transport protein ExbD